MSTCIVPACGREYKTEEVDGVEALDKCPECKKRSQEVALKVDIEMAKIRAKRGPTPPSLIRQIFTEDEIMRGDAAGPAKRVNIRDIGITPNG